MTKVTNAQIMVALRESRGILSPAARKLAITRQALHHRVNVTPELQEFRAQLDEEILDRAEEVLFEAVDADKDSSDARWILERKGKSRGYATRVEAALDDKQIEAFVFAFGGDANKLRALRDSLNPAKSGK